MSLASGVQVRRLSPALGAELVGLDLREDQPADVIELARRAFDEHHLVLVRGPELPALAQRRFASWFGRVDTMGYAGGNTASPETYISNTRAEGVAREGSLLKHSDYCFFDTLLRGLCLYGEEVPSHGGETVFVNAQRAGMELPPALVARVTGLHARHVYDYRNDYGTARFRIASAPDAPNASHPILLPHPVTGAPILYVNELMTDSIEELPADEGEALLQELFAYLDDPSFRYEHAWQAGDLIVWDNLALQHGRTDIPAGARRSLRRLQIAG